MSGSPKEQAIKWGVSIGTMGIGGVGVGLYEAGKATMDAITPKMPKTQGGGYTRGKDGSGPKVTTTTTAGRGSLLRRY